MNCLSRLLFPSLKCPQNLFSLIASLPIPIGPAPTRLHETFLESDPNGNGITFESGPVWVRIEDPNGFGSVESRVNARPIR